MYYIMLWKMLSMWEIKGYNMGGDVINRDIWDGGVKYDLE
jgi:hypothetical protein